MTKEAHAGPKMRAAAESAVKTLNDWFVGIDYREDVYKSIKAFADTKPQLDGEDETAQRNNARLSSRGVGALPPDETQRG